MPAGYPSVGPAETARDTGGLVRRTATEHALPMATRAESTPVDVADRPLVLVDVRASACGYQALVWALQEAQRRAARPPAGPVWPGASMEAEVGCAGVKRAPGARVARGT